jgi:hypothetical protein
MPLFIRVIRKYSRQVCTINYIFNTDFKKIPLPIKPVQNTVHREAYFAPGSPSDISCRFNRYQ